MSSLSDVLKTVPSAATKMSVVEYCVRELYRDDPRWGVAFVQCSEESGAIEVIMARRVSPYWAVCVTIKPEELAGIERGDAERLLSVLEERIEAAIEARVDA